MKKVAIVSATRTAIGKFGGSLKDVGPGRLGSLTLKASLDRVGVSGEDVDEVIMGNVLSAGHGQNVARQASMHAGCSVETSALTVNKVCGSGLKSVMLGAQSVMLGDSEIVLAGGMETMSMTPYADKDARWGKKMGNSELVDLMVHDGLWDIFNDYHMGTTAENVAERWDISREEQDVFAAESQRRAEVAVTSGRFKDEIVPVELPSRKGEPVIFDTDEFPRFGTTANDLGKLRPVFKPDGSVTAGNASGINDGAASVLLMSEEEAQKRGLTPLATIKSYASSGVHPEIMGVGPITAVQQALAKAGITIDDLDLIELNEAFASQSLAVLRDLGLDQEKVNVNGGAIALGHPIGASGTRVLVTLLHEMKKREARYGMAALCIGGGQGIAMVLERDMNESTQKEVSE